VLPAGALPMLDSRSTFARTSGSRHVRALSSLVSPFAARRSAITLERTSLVRSCSSLRTERGEDRGESKSRRRRRISAELARVRRPAALRLVRSSLSHAAPLMATANSTQEKRVLSIQSHVVAGYVGALSSLSPASSDPTSAGS